MTVNDWAAVSSAVIAGLTILGVIARASIKWIVINYLSELKPNGGGSMNDRMTRVEKRVDDIYTLLIERN